MDIANFDSLVAQGRIIDPADVNPNEDYFIIGKYTKHYTTNSYKYTDYPVYAIKAGDVMGGSLGVQSVTGLDTDNTDPQNPIVQISVDGTTITGNGTPGNPLVASGGSSIPTLQQVLNNNHDLFNNNNFQGTGAGTGNTGVQVIAFGAYTGLNNTGTNVTALAYQAARDNTGNNLNAIGTDAGKGNSGDRVNAFGSSAAQNNTGDDVNAFGNGAGLGNALNGMTIFSNASMPTYANFAAASAAITVGLGASAGSTYLYHDQATNSIGAVRL